MKLRDHPLLSYKGLRSWPPLWVRIDDVSKCQVESDETGTLIQVRIDNLADCKIMLRMEYSGHEYAAVLMFDAQEFCLRVYQALKHYVGRAVKQLGEVEIE